MSTTNVTGRTSEAAAAIRHHYDIGNSFYSLWLDRSMTYSCALWDGLDDTLDEAQERKLRYHLDAVRAERAGSVLDIGCGWGSILERLAATPAVRRSIGLTLSEEQAAYVRSRDYPGVEVRTESWMEYQPAEQFDGIISIGAFEHFARPDDRPDEKMRVYRDFFTRCRDWLSPGGVLSLQTIAYANMSANDASPFIQQEIFPNAELPTLAEICAAVDGLFEVRSVGNGRLDYARTCEAWVHRLKANRDRATALVGPDVVARYVRYLTLSAVGFRMEKICLLRLVLRPYRSNLFEARGAS